MKCRVGSVVTFNPYGKGFVVLQILSDRILILDYFSDGRPTTSEARNHDFHGVIW